MSTALATIAPNGIQRADEWSQDRVEFIRKAFCGGAPDGIAGTFIEISKRRGLAPEERHIYLVERGKGNWVIQTGIDGYRSLAERSGEYAGNDDPVFDTEDAKHPNKASVTVWRMKDGVRCPYTASARWSEYSAGSPIWNKMPYLMLGKCAEALALRKAFPTQLAGIYTDAEMDQAESPQGRVMSQQPARPVTKPVARVEARPPQQRVIVDAETGEIEEPPANVATDKQKKMLWALTKQIWAEDDVARFALDAIARDELGDGFTSLKVVTKQEASRLIDVFTSAKEENDDFAALRERVANLIPDEEDDAEWGEDAG